MDEKKLIPTIVNIAKTVDKQFETGVEKKYELYKILKLIIGEDKFNENKQVIDFILETAIFISKVHKISGLNETSFGYCC